MGRQTITACLIVRDEEVRLPAALASVAFCDEVVVVDSGSTDRTVDVARAAGAVVVENAWPGFAAQRNVAIDHATSDWVLEVDADERISPELRRSIERFLSGPPPPDVDLCACPRRDRFLGAQLGPSAKYPDYRHRLLRRGAHRHDEARQVHEGLWPHGRCVALEGDLEHFLAGSWGEMVQDAWSYARLESAHVAPLDSAAAYARAIVVRPVAKLGFRLVVDGGWRDGWQGLVKIALDCAVDAVVWTRRATGRAPSAPTAETAADGGHFAPRAPRVGPVRLVAVARGPRQTRAAAKWLADARRAGADTALVTDVEAPEDGDVRFVPRLGPLLLTRALGAEEQRRTIDALVLAPGRAQRLARLLPSDLRGAVPPRSLAETPADAVRAVEKATRSSG